MPFIKNQSGNPKGKPKGAINKTTKDLKEFIQNFISNNLDNIQNDFDKLEPKDRLNYIDRLMKYVISTKVENEINIDIDALSDENIEKITNILIKKIEL
jgi:hypothetical protein